MIPLIKLPELPYSTGTPDANATIPVVLNNDTTVRVPWTILTTAKVSHTSEVPVDYASEGEEDQLAFANDALYMHHAGEWRKIAAYKSNWGDLSSKTRALLVNTIMALTPEELANARATLDIGIATTAKAGLVKGANQTEQASIAAYGSAVSINADGTMYVPSASGTVKGVTTVWDGTVGDAANHAWVAAELNALSERIVGTSVATPTTIGGLLAGTEGVDPFYVDQVTKKGQLRTAAVGSAGIVELADAVSAGANGVPTAGQVHAAILEGTSSLGNATVDKAGLVRPMTSGVWNLTTNPASILDPAQIAEGVGPLYLQDAQGGLDIYPASDDIPGVVMCYDTIPAASTETSYYKKVLTTEGVVAYVRAQLDAYVPPPAAYPVATSGSPGAVLPGNTMQYDQTTGLLNVPIAGKYKQGTVYLSGAITDSSATGDGGVPTAGDVKSYVNAKVVSASDVAALSQTVANMQAQVISLQLQADYLQSQIDELKSK